MFFWHSKFTGIQCVAIKQIIAGLFSDRYPPEKPKFKSPLVLLHGLWTGSWCWETWASHFCNLGWDCSAINFRGRSGETPVSEFRRLALEDCVADLSEVLASFSYPPVLLAMNLGCLVGLKATENSRLAALILVSPAAPRNLRQSRSRARRLLRLKYSPLIFLRRPIRIDRNDFQANFLHPLPDSKHPEIYRRTVPESPLLVREFLLPRIDLTSGSPGCPSLVVAGAEDAIQPAASAREIAELLGADFREYNGQGHWMIEQDSQAIVRDIHRWVVQKLGEQILLSEIP
ncbi:MAG: alpha/beta fold hydrolase [Candidatus Binatia bacterium]